MSESAIIIQDLTKRFETVTAVDGLDLDRQPRRGHVSGSQDDEYAFALLLELEAVVPWMLEADLYLSVERVLHDLSCPVEIRRQKVGDLVVLSDGEFVQRGSDGVQGGSRDEFAELAEVERDPVDVVPRLCLRLVETKQRYRGYHKQTHRQNEEPD